MEWLVILIIQLTYTIFVYLSLILRPTCFTINSRIFCKYYLLKPNSILNKVFPYKNKMYSPHIKIVAYSFISSIIILSIDIILSLFSIFEVYDLNILKIISIILLPIQFIINLMLIVYINIKNKILFKIEQSMDRNEYIKLKAYLNNKYKNFDT